MSENDLQKRLREVRIWAKVSHSPNIVHYNTSWTENTNSIVQRMNEDTKSEGTTESKSVLEGHEMPLSGLTLYIQMELCRMTLKNAIKQINEELNQRIGNPITTIGAFIATQLTEEIVNGLHYLHSSSPPIIHCDLKPENIFITDGRDENFIKIGDLGSAIFLDDYDAYSNHFSGRIGTDGYIPPPPRDGSYSMEYAKKFDAFSLGCMMMNLLTIEKHITSTDER